MPSKQTTWWGVIAGVVLLSICLGLPQFHYAAALMVAAILRHKDKPNGAVLWPFTYRPAERSL